MKNLKTNKRRLAPTKVLKSHFADWQHCGFGYKSFLHWVGSYYGVNPKLIRGFIK